MRAFRWLFPFRTGKRFACLAATVLLAMDCKGDDSSSTSNPRTSGGTPTTDPSSDGNGLPPLPSTPPGLTPPPDVALTRVDVPPLLPSGPYVPTHWAVQDGPWDNPATWGGSLPTTGQIVGIARGRTVELRGATADLGGLWVDGSLTFGDTDVALTTRFVILSGELKAGTSTAPYTKQAVVTLTGTDTKQDVVAMGTKGIVVMEGGLLKLHGELRLAWTQLTADASAGATTMTVKDDAGTWRPGDRLVLTTSGFDPRESEVVTVTNVTGTNVAFTPALKFTRTAFMKTIDQKVLDERPAVGLLTRNIRIQGADDSEADGFGGHIMVMANGNAQVSGIELTKMGQRTHQGRYPFHWHIAGNREGNYLMSAAIHDTFQRACVVHSTHNVSLDGNVAFNIPNHAFVWAEDGDEYGNSLTRNLGVLVRSPPAKDFAFHINNPFQGNSAQAEQRAGVFWGRSFHQHVLRGNVSAGSLDGSGFFFDLLSPSEHSGNEGGGLIFDGNTAYATFKVVDTGNQINYPEATAGHGLMVTTGTNGIYPHNFSHYTGYHNVSSAWIEDRSTHLKDSIVADSKNGVMVLRGVLERLTVVGNSGHPIGIDNNSAGILVGRSNHGGRRSPVVLDSTIIDAPGTGFSYELDNISPESDLKGLRFINTPKRARFGEPSKFDFGTPPNFVLFDRDGSLIGDGVATHHVLRDSNLINAQCVWRDEMSSYACPASANLLLRASTSLLLLEESGIPSYVEGWNYQDKGMPASGKLAASYVGNGRQYEVIGPAATTYDFTLEQAAGKSVELTFSVGGPPVAVTQNGREIPSAASLGDLRTGNGSSQFFEGATQRLFLRIVGDDVDTQQVTLQAPLLAPSIQGRPAASPPTTASGFAVSFFSGAASTYKPRYELPGGEPSLTKAVSASALDVFSSTPALDALGADAAAVVRGFFYAPDDGMYRLALWGNGGGTSLFVGDTWVMGEPAAFINSNWVKDNVLTTAVSAFMPNGQIALRAGWHPYTVVFARFPNSNGNREFHLRLAAPSKPETWVYAQVKQP